MSGGTFNREYRDDPELAYQCYDTYSAGSNKYTGVEDTRKKLDEMRGRIARALEL
jgi:hypothetical protein